MVLKVMNRSVLLMNCVECFFFQAQGERPTEESLAAMLNEVDVNKNGQIDLSEFLQVCRPILLSTFHIIKISLF